MAKLSAFLKKRIIVRELLVSKLIFFFIITPFLSSCGGGGSSSGTDTPAGLTDEQIVASAADDQNRYAQTAISSTIDMFVTLTDGKKLIEDTFGNVNPTREDIKAYIESNPQAAETLSTRLDTLVGNVLLSTENLLAASEQMVEMERTINDKFETSGSTASSEIRPAQNLLLEAALVLTLLGLAFQLAKDDSNNINDAVIDSEEAAITGAYDGIDDTADAVKTIRNCENIGRIWSSEPEILQEHGKTIVSNGVTTAASEVSGQGGYKKVKFVIDVYSAINAVESTVNGIFGIQKCSGFENRDSEKLTPKIRTKLDVDYESLSPGEFYIGTPDETGTFHNIPPGQWTFVAFVDGHLRTVAGCIDVGADDPDPVEVSITPVPLASVGDLLESSDESPYQSSSCSDISECEEGYICYLGFCEPISDFPIGSTDYVGHWRIIEENTTSFDWVADTVMFENGRFISNVWTVMFENELQGTWSYSTPSNKLTLVRDNGSVVISGPVHWENEDDFWHTREMGIWTGHSEQSRFAWIKQNDDCQCTGATCPERCPD